jgi:hypothetical protein
MVLRQLLPITESQRKQSQHLLQTTSKMKLSLPIIVPLIALVQAFPGHGIGASELTIPSTNLTLSARGQFIEIGDRDACVDIGLADGSTLKNWCQPAHKCFIVDKPEHQIRSFDFSGSTICTLYIGGSTGGDKFCIGKKWDFQEGDKERHDIPKWWSEHGQAYSCYIPK